MAENPYKSPTVAAAQQRPATASGFDWSRLAIVGVLVSVVSCTIILLQVVFGFTSLQYRVANWLFDSLQSNFWSLPLVYTIVVLVPCAVLTVLILYVLHRLCSVRLWFLR